MALQTDYVACGNASSRPASATAESPCRLCPARSWPGRQATGRHIVHSCYLVIPGKVAHPYRVFGCRRVAAHAPSRVFNSTGSGFRPIEWWWVISGGLRVAYEDSSFMIITLQCPRLSCRAVLQVPETVRGKRVRCGKCGSTFIVPGNIKAKPAPAKPQK